jgi:hypothetical protein
MIMEEQQHDANRESRKIGQRTALVPVCPPRIYTEYRVDRIQIAGVNHPCYEANNRSSNQEISNRLGTGEFAFHSVILHGNYR